MDAIRQIRFVYPPLVFASAVGIALWSAPEDYAGRVTDKFTANAAIALVTFVLGSGALLACGYVIGSLPIFLLRAGANILGTRHYESLIEDCDHERVWRRLGGVNGQLREDDRAYLAAAFNHVVVGDRMYEWLQRRWNAFNIAMHTAAALSMAIVVVYFTSVNAGAGWYWCASILVVMFGFLAHYTWLDVKAMTSLLARTFVMAPPDKAAEKTADG